MALVALTKPKPRPMTPTPLLCHPVIATPRELVAIAAILLSFVATLSPVLTPSTWASLTRVFPSCRFGPTRPSLPYQTVLSQTIPPRPAPPWPPPWQSSKESMITQELMITQDDPVAPTWCCPVMSMPQVSWQMRPFHGCLLLVHMLPLCLHQPTTSSIERYHWLIPSSQRRLGFIFIFRRSHYFASSIGYMEVV